jgi:xanthine/CO dehydrogenase XdhC/CoxF family maturation factor
MRCGARSPTSRRSASAPRSACSCAAAVGWLVTVVDHRPTFATVTRFPDAERVVQVDAVREPASLAASLALDRFAAAVSMAHAAAHDRAYVHALLGVSTLRYLGVLGPRRRTLELLDGAPGIANGALPPHLYAPIGLDLGAETPDEIALAIVSEIAVALAGRSAVSLRERGGPIHEKRS